MCLWTVIWGLKTSIRGIRPAEAFTTNGAARIPSRTISKRSTMAKGSPSGHTTAKILRRRPWRGLRHIPRLFWGVLQTLRIRRSVSARGWGNLRRTSGATPRRAAVPRLRARSPSTTLPSGWRVPPPEAWTLEQTTVSSTIEGGCYLYTGSVWPYYPYAGLLHVMPTGKEMYVGVGDTDTTLDECPGESCLRSVTCGCDDGRELRRPAGPRSCSSTVRIIRPQPIL